MSYGSTVAGQEKKRRISFLLLASIFLVLNLFLFLPFSVYHGNMAEFDVGFATMLQQYIIPASLLLIVVVGSGVFLSQKRFGIFVSVVFALGALLWLQGDFLLWKYGLLDGHAIDWSKNSWRGWVDGSIWVLVLISACIFWRYIYKLVPLAAIVFLSLQVLNLVLNSYFQPDIWKNKITIPSSSRSAPRETFEFSPQVNVIYILLDAFQSDLFQQIVEEDPEYYKKELDGFVFFEEAMGSFATTCMTVPAIFSGKVYKNNVPVRQFIQETLDGRTIPNVLYENGFAVDLVHCVGLYKYGRYSSFYQIARQYGLIKERYEKMQAALMLDIALFRAVPHFIKRWVYNKQSWLVQRIYLKERGLEFVPLSHKAFFTDLIENMSIDRKKPVYKYIHLATTHPPLVINQDCEFTGMALPSKRKNYIVQDRCALEQFIEFLRKLKSLGIYDNSLIVLHADTGVGLRLRCAAESLSRRVIGNALPLLAVKPLSSRGTMRTSRAPVMLTDIPATVSSLLGLGEEFPGSSVFDVDEAQERERKYYHYKWRRENWQSTFLPHLNEYLVTGSVFDGKAWRLNRIICSPETRQAFSTMDIDFGNKKYDKYCVFHWGGNESSKDGKVSFRWALGNSVCVKISLLADAMLLKAVVRPYVFDEPMVMTIKLDGKIVGNWTLANVWEWQKKSIMIKSDVNRPNISVLQFLFSQWKEEEGKRPLAVMFDSLKLVKQ